MVLFAVEFLESKHAFTQGAWGAWRGILFSVR